MSVKWGSPDTAERERLLRHQDFALRMLEGLEPMQALRIWTDDAVSLVDALPENWPGDDEQHAAEWDRLRLMVRAVFGLVRSGRLEPTRR